MKKEYTVEQMAETRWFYTFTEPNAKGEKLVIEIFMGKNDGGSRALPVLWYKSGMTDRVLETYWCISTYVTDTEGRCWIMYNPQNKRSDDGKRAVIDFDWMLEATEDNREKLINEAFRLFSSAVGETATEEKIRKVKEFAKERDIEVMTEIPEGWVNLNYCTAPIGSTYIGNMKPNFHNLRDENRREALLLV
ncbi:hypothetical protein [Clostridium sp. HBUAS56010]|uniref:hypothetical protein n=1 Tax=Clostridium sp. HBUAS56010 TaxID=2571127 RepID=UPI0011775E17|nr:hypothetical protein [Clostridium sp. HBUAS56010]